MGRASIKLCWSGRGRTPRRICASRPSSAWAVSTTSRLLALGVTVKKTRWPSQSLYHPCQVPERSLRTPAMGVSSIECGNFRIALRLLPFSLDTRLLEAVREVLLDGLDGPCITPKQADRRGDISTFVGP